MTRQLELRRTSGWGGARAGAGRKRAAGGAGGGGGAQMWGAIRPSPTTWRGRGEFGGLWAGDWGTIALSRAWDDTAAGASADLGVGRGACGGGEEAGGGGPAVGAASV